MAMLDPCERTIVTSIPAGYGVLDIGWALSQQNRKAYRQGMEYAISNVEIFGLDPAAEGSVQMFRLPNTWVTANAWVKSFKVWREQQDDAMEAGGSWSSRARYHDFKLYYNAGHLAGEYAGTSVTQMHPSGFLSQATAQLIDPGAEMEWEASTFTVPNVAGSGGTTEEYYGGMLGGDTGTYRGLIRAYAESRARPHPSDPSVVEEGGSATPDGGLFTEMQDVGEDLKEIVLGIREENNAAPYVIGGTDSDEEFYPWGTNQGSDQGVSQDRLIVRAGSTIATDSSGPFTALCGLLWFNNGTGSAIETRIHITPGSYHGVMARPMQDVN